ncbi:MAG: MarR family transcriptional regulator [Bacteroidetes bacterium]|nr:MarR family transcriptional regulator [Bacteroidota bacterium]
MDKKKQKPMILIFSLFPKLIRSVLQGFESETGNRAGLNHTQVKTLLYIYNNEPSPMSKICHHVNLEKGSMTSVIDTLINNDFVQRNREEADRRKVLISLTEQGKITAKQCRDDVIRYINKKLSILTEEERTQFWDSLMTLENITRQLQENSHE